jgi:glycosyltransferase involved in cell wall biosynthesis
MRRSDGITISEHTKREALRIFPGTDPSRLTPLWLGTRKSLLPVVPPRTGPLELPLRCVYVGALENRKNVFALLQNLGKVFGGIPFTLDLVGKYFDHEGTKARAWIAASPFGKNVFLRGILSEEELRALMERSEITLFPSLEEGFGLPVAEGMAHGHVVFAFRNSSIPEVGGDAVVLADNNDFAAWGHSLKNLVENPEACAALRAKARARANLFSEESMRTRYREYFLKALDNAERNSRAG